MVKWIGRAIASVLCVWALLVGVVAVAMLQTPERFGRFMRHMPAALVWGATPARPMWLWARAGDYVVDRNGRVAYKSAAGPFGFKPSELEAALNQVLASDAAPRSETR